MLSVILVEIVAAISEFTEAEAEERRNMYQGGERCSKRRGKGGGAMNILMIPHLRNWQSNFYSLP